MTLREQIEQLQFENGDYDNTPTNIAIVTGYNRAIADVLRVLTERPADRPHHRTSATVEAESDWVTEQPAETPDRWALPADAEHKCAKCGEPKRCHGKHNECIFTAAPLIERPAETEYWCGCRICEMHKIQVMGTETDRNIRRKVERPAETLLGCLMCEGRGVVRNYLDRMGDYEKYHCPNCKGTGKTAAPAKETP